MRTRVHLNALAGEWAESNLSKQRIQGFFGR
jgi:hypothetical protein